MARFVHQTERVLSVRRETSVQTDSHAHKTAPVLSVFQAAFAQTAKSAHRMVPVLNALQEVSVPMVRFVRKRDNAQIARREACAPMDNSAPRAVFVLEERRLERTAELEVVHYSVETASCNRANSVTKGQRMA